MSDTRISIQDKIEQIKKLVSRGADINDTNSRGFTPIMRAVYNQQIDIAALLFELGADAWFMDPVTGHNLVNLWSQGFSEYEYWEKLEEIIFLFCKYDAWKKPEWCEIFIKLIFDKGWPKASQFLSGNLENMRKYK